MLVLSRKQKQSIVINGNVKVTILSISGNNVRVGISAPDDVRIIRAELDEWDTFSSAASCLSPDLDNEQLAAC